MPSFFTLATAGAASQSLWLRQLPKCLLCVTINNAEAPPASLSKKESNTRAGPGSRQGSRCPARSPLTSPTSPAQPASPNQKGALSHLGVPLALPIQALELPTQEVFQKVPPPPPQHCTLTSACRNECEGGSVSPACPLPHLLCEHLKAETFSSRRSLRHGKLTPLCPRSSTQDICSSSKSIPHLFA